MSEREPVTVNTAIPAKLGILGARLLVKLQASLLAIEETEMEEAKQEK